MSMHKKPLTKIEETGLILHGFGLDIGKPSMTADIFRHGIAWGQSSVSDQIKDIQELLAHDTPFDDNLRARLTELLNGDWTNATLVHNGGHKGQAKPVQRMK